MTDFCTYKAKQVGYGQQNLLLNHRVLRRQHLNDQRRDRRHELFSAGRDNSRGLPHQELLMKQETKKVDEDYANCLQTLAKWREERNRRKVIEKLRAKPPFVVGIVRHRWYSPPITKDGNMKKKQKRENMINVRNKVLKQAPLSSMDHQFKAPIGLKIIPSPLDRRVAKKTVQMKNYFRNVFNDSVMTFLSEEFNTSTPIQPKFASIDYEGVSPEQQEQEERSVPSYKNLLNHETEHLIGLCNSFELTKNEDLTTGDIHHLIEDCHARFKKLEELETNNN